MTSTPYDAAIVQSARDAIFSIALDRTILSWNPAAEDRYGYGADEVLGADASVVLPPERAADLDLILRRIGGSEHVPCHESERLAGSGVRIQVITTVSPIRDREGRIIGASFIDRHIAEHEAVATVQAAVPERSELALVEALQAHARSRRFLADAAHQLRTPVAGIRVAAENLLRGTQPPDTDLLLADLVRETIRAGRLVDSLLRVAHLDEGEELTPVPTDLVDLCANEADRAWSLAPHLDIVLRADPPPTGPRDVDADAVREIVANLLDNARRFAVERIEVLLVDGPSQVEIRVSDDGPGLSPGDEERVFERFVSLDGRGGAGLGLAIARQLARAHGGELLYGGRAFVLRLPRP